MVPFFDINNHFSVNILPNYKRLKKWIQTIRGYLGSLSWLNSIFIKFMSGSDDLDFYNSLIAYSKYDKIKDNFAVYESLISNNLGNPTSDTNSWFKVLDSFISKTESVTYTGRQLQFEYALNHYFQQQLISNSLVGFKQPTGFTGNDYSPKSDIFISNVKPSYTTFIMSPNGIGGSYMSPTTSTGFMSISPIYGGGTTYAYVINIPLAVYNSLGISNSIRENVIRNFADKINPSGCQYSIVTY